MPPYQHGHTIKTTKGYPRATAGPCRGLYLHRVVAAALIGRELARDEEVHHKDGNRLNFRWNNLMVLGNKDHGWVSAKQAWYMRERDKKLKKEWDNFMADEAKRFDKEVAIAKADGVPWQQMDGGMPQRFNEWRSLN